jgi:hypothetical protein
VLSKTVLCVCLSKKKQKKQAKKQAKKRKKQTRDTEDLICQTQKNTKSARPERPPLGFKGLIV